MFTVDIGFLFSDFLSTIWGKIIRTVLCCIVCNFCTHTHTHEQFLIDCWFWFSLDLDLLFVFFAIFFLCCLLFTGSIARSANLPVFSLLRGRFWGFSPRRGDTLHRWGEIWHGGGDRRSPPPCQISPPSVQRQGCRTPKIEIFTQIWPKCGI